MEKPTITITIDPIKGPQLNSNQPLEVTYLILSGTANNVLIQLLASKQTNLVQPVGPNGNGRPTLVS
jgi:hypothetical protein